MIEWEMYLEGREDGAVEIICTAEKCMRRGRKTTWNQRGLWLQDVSGDMPYRPNPVQVAAAWLSHLARAHAGEDA